MTHGLDISHFTSSHNDHGPITAEEVAMFVRRAVERVVVSIADQAIARQQIQAIAPSGIEIQTYRYYYWPTMKERRQDDERFIAEMRNSGVNIQMHWLDFEDTTTRRPVADNEADIDEMISWWRGKCSTGIYTGAWWWEDYMENSSRFSFMPLWFADYDWEETLVLDKPFGGWTRGVMKQTMGDWPLEGMVWCDTNYFEKVTPIPPPDPPIEPPLPPAPSFKQKALEELETARLALESATRAVEQIPEPGK